MSINDDSKITLAEEKIRLARLRIQAFKELRLFGCVMYLFPLFLDEEKEFLVPEAGAYVMYSFKNKNFEIHMNKTVVNKFTPAMVMFVILHEIMHVLHKHQVRGEFKQHEMWNLAGDHVINTAIDDDIQHSHLKKVEMPTKDTFAPFFIDHFNGKGQQITVEDAYAYLIENTTFTKQGISMACPSCGGSGKGKGGKGKCKDCKGTGQDQQPGQGSGTITTGEFHDPNTGQKRIVHTDIVFNPPGQKQKSGQDASEEIERQIEQIRGEIRAYRDTTQRDRGHSSGSLSEMLDELLHVEIPIETLLKKAIQTKLSPCSSNRSWKNLNRVYRGIGLTLPGHGVEENIETGVYVIDSSGSISTQELKIAGGAVLACAEIFRDMYILKHDHKLLDEKYYEDGIEDEAAVASDLKEQHGRGGTSHKEVFDRIEELYLERNGLGLVIMITDYYSDVTELFDSNEYEWCDNVPVSIMLPPAYKNMEHRIPKYVDDSPIIMPDPDKKKR